MSLRSNLILLCIALAVPGAALHAQQAPVKIGFVGALSGASALSGEAITRGLSIAIDEVNGRGGVLGGRKLALVHRDDASTPARGQQAARELIEKEQVAVIFGGIDTPVSMALIGIVHEHRVPYMGVWAAGTGITQNGRSPNFMFRVSAVDERVNSGMVKYATRNLSARKPGVILVNNPWGDSNRKGLEKASQQLNVPLAGIEKYEATDSDMSPQLLRLKQAGADALIMVGNAEPAASVIRSMEKMNWNVPVVSHWGISGGRFDELAGPRYKDVTFVQTYSFNGAQNPTGARVTRALMSKYPEIKRASDIAAPVGVANAYDALMLTARAIETAGSTDGDKIRLAFYEVPNYAGLIKHYVRPFTPANHDALQDSDYIWVRFDGKTIVPVRK